MMALSWAGLRPVRTSMVSSGACRSVASPSSDSSSATSTFIVVPSGVACRGEGLSSTRPALPARWALGSRSRHRKRACLLPAPVDHLLLGAVVGAETHGAEGLHPQLPRELGVLRSGGGRAAEQIPHRTPLRRLV